MPTGDENRASGGNSHEIRSCDSEGSGRPDAPGLQIDRVDAGGRSVGQRAATADQIDQPSEGCCGGVRRRMGQRRNAPHLAGDRIEREHSPAGGSVLERAACDHDEPADGRDGRVAHGERQVGDNARPGAGTPGDNRVEPAAAGETSDDVCGCRNRGRRAVGAGGGQVSGGRGHPGREIDAGDARELTGSVTAAEDVGRTPDAHARRVVDRVRQTAERAAPSAADDERLAQRGVGGTEPCEQRDTPSCEGNRRRILDGERQTPGRMLIEIGSRSYVPAGMQDARRAPGTKAGSGVTSQPRRHGRRASRTSTSPPSP